MRCQGMSGQPPACAAGHRRGDLPVRGGARDCLPPTELQWSPPIPPLRGPVGRKESCRTPRRQTHRFREVRLQLSRMASSVARARRRTRRTSRPPPFPRLRTIALVGAPKDCATVIGGTTPSSRLRPAAPMSPPRTARVRVGPAGGARRPPTSARPSARRRRRSGPGHGVEQEPLVGLEKAVLLELHAHARRSDGESRSGLLGEHAQLDSARVAEVEEHAVAVELAAAELGEVVLRGRAEHQRHELGRVRQALAGAQEERHAASALVVDLRPQCDEGSRSSRTGRHPPRRGSPRTALAPRDPDRAASAPRRPRGGSCEGRPG